MGTPNVVLLRLPDARYCVALYRRPDARKAYIIHNRAETRFAQPYDSSLRF